MSSKIPADRLQLTGLAPKGYAAMLRLSGSIQLDHEIRELIDIRASQINGCAFCLDMHWKDARAAGQSEERLYMISAWRESPLYNDRERAALELCEAMTLIADGFVRDHVWEQAAAAFDEYELGQLVFAITTINAWNRLNVTTRVQPGHYEPGQLREWRIPRADVQSAPVEVGEASSS